MNRTIEIVHEFGRHAAVTTLDYRPGEPGERIPEAFRTVAAYLGAAGIPATGAAIGFYRMRDGGAMTASIGFEVDDAVPGDGTVESLHIPAGETLRTLHIGPYERLPETYAALQSYASGHGLQLDEHAMWEEYRSHPEVEPGLTETVVHWPCTRVPSRVAR
jgi:effector-binding domain-containing protein